MAIFCVSDIHGNFKALLDVLKQANIDFKQDKLYVLGDMIDWGKQPVEVLLYVKGLCEKYPNNVFATLGNHELMMLSTLNGDNDLAYSVWLKNRGYITCEQLKYLSEKDTNEYLKLIDWLLSLKITYNENNYILTHSRPLSDFATMSSTVYKMHSDFPMSVVNAVWNRVEIFTHPETGEVFASTGVSHDKTLISGHTMTNRFHDSNDIFQMTGYINIDCGAKVLGYEGYGCGKLGLLKIDEHNNKVCYYSDKIK